MECILLLEVFVKWCSVLFVIVIVYFLSFFFLFFKVFFNLIKIFFFVSVCNLKIWYLFWIVEFIVWNGLFVVVLIKVRSLFFKWGNRKFCFVLFRWWILFKIKMRCWCIFVFCMIIFIFFLLWVIVFNRWNGVLVFFVIVLVMDVFFVFGGLYKIIDWKWLVWIICYKIFFLLIKCCCLIIFWIFVGCIWCVSGCFIWIVFFNI